METHVPLQLLPAELQPKELTYPTSSEFYEEFKHLQMTVSLMEKKMGIIEEKLQPSSQESLVFGP